ncbi:MarC family protein [Chlamydiifrater phoenicopteri]|uniref:MarC family protein n=1 Tax=Chlamydiifrater phoenicopteri TaxID=2681469 RepID=UPI001BCEA6B1|nr:MarC family protein [Chlamydiifrater phoenicopteri]
MLLALFQLSLLFFMLFDALGSFPVFVTLLKDFSPERRRKIIIRECLFALATLVVFITFGRKIFHLFNVSLYSFQVVGGAMLFAIGLDMAFSPLKQDLSTTNQKVVQDPIFFPLAFPVLTGPAVISATLSCVEEKVYSLEFIFCAICLAWAASLVIFLYSTVFNRIMGKDGLVALERLFGVILLLIAGNLVLKGLGIAFNIGFYAT